VVPASGCSVTYAVRSQWDNGATVDLTLTNTGTADLAGWTLTFELRSGRSTKTPSPQCRGLEHQNRAGHHDYARFQPRKARWEGQSTGPFHGRRYTLPLIFS